MDMVDAHVADDMAHGPQLVAGEPCRANRRFDEQRLDLMARSDCGSALAGDGD